MTFSKLCLITLTIALFAVSCQKDEPETPNLSPEEQAIAEAQEFLQASALMESIFNSADEESRQQPDLNGFQSEGPEVAPRNNCRCAYCVLRRAQLTLNLSCQAV